MHGVVGSVEVVQSSTASGDVIMVYQGANMELDATNKVEGSGEGRWRNRSAYKIPFEFRRWTQVSESRISSRKRLGRQGMARLGWASLSGR